MLERTQWDAFWVPPDTTVVDRPELLYLSCPRDVPVLNSALRVRSTNLGALVAEVSAAHRGRCSRWTMYPSEHDGPLQAALEACDYVAAGRHYGYSIATETPRGPIASNLVVERIVDREGLRDVYRVRNLAFGADYMPTEDELDTYVAELLAPRNRVIRFVVRDAHTGAPLSSGGLTVHRALDSGLRSDSRPSRNPAAHRNEFRCAVHEWSDSRTDFGFLWAGGTVPSGRGRGAYSALVTARIEAARALGLPRVGLYARVDTSAPIVAAQGFERHGPMTFWERPALL
jgi:hypothetical protein